MLKITADNYTYYKNLLKILWETMPKPKALDDIAWSPLDRFAGLEQENMAQARQILQIGLRDVLQHSADYPPNLRESINARLTKEGFPTLLQLLQPIKDIPAQVLKRGKMRNSEEYYIIKEVLDDVEYPMSESDKEKLDEIFFAFEKKTSK